MNFIPKEEIFSRLSGKDILNFCRINRSYRDFCRNKRLWENKVATDYPDYVHDKPNRVSWRQYYFLLTTSRPIIIARDDEFVEVPSVVVTWDYLKSLVGSDDDRILIIRRHEIIDLYSRLLDRHFGSNPAEASYVIILSLDDPIDFQVKGVPCHELSTQDLLDIISVLADITVNHEDIKRIMLEDRRYLCRLIDILDQLGILKLVDRENLV
jgi:hypothetical protein